MADEEAAPLKLMQVNKAIEQEMAAWDRDKMDFRAFGVHTINLDNQMWALVDYIKQLVPEFDEVEFEYRWKARFLMKVNELRNEVKKQQTVQSITQGIVDANGKPIDIPRGQG